MESNKKCTKCLRPHNGSKKLCLKCVVVSHCSKIRKKTTTSTFKYTNSQIQAINQIKYFLKRPVGVFSLSGPGGVGKTEVLRYFAQPCTAFITFTHKAANVLTSRLKSYGSYAQTIHKFIGGEVQYNKDGSQYFTDKIDTKWFQDKIKDITLIVVDEASMVSHDLYKRLMTIDRHILASGDEAQLPPVVKKGEGDMDECELHQTPPFYYYHEVDFNLTENVRNDNANYNELLTTVRTCILNRDYNPLSTSRINHLLLKNCYQFSDSTWRDKMTSVARINEDDIIILANRTKKESNTIGKINSFIRYIKFNNPTESFLEGEKIHFIDYYKDTLHTYYTCDQEEVIKMDKADRYLNGTIIKCYELTLKTKCVIYYPLKEDEMLFNITKSQYKKDIKEKVKFMRNQKDITNEWKIYYGNIKSVKAPIEYRYALSIHKSQGSSYDYVITNVCDFNWMLNRQDLVEQYYKLLYVALSRSRSSSMLF